VQKLSLTRSEQRRELDILLKTHRFREGKTDRSREILEFLSKQGDEDAQEGDGAVQAKDIAREFYRGDRDVSTARKAVHTLKGLLKRHYHKGEGRVRDIEIQIKEGPGYRLIYSVNEPSAGDVVERFWNPYFLVDAGTPRIVFAEPVFFRNAERIYIRHLDCNDPNGRWAFWDLLGKDKAEELIPSYHYLPAGELLAVLIIMREFQRRKVFLDFGTTKTYSTWGSLKDENVILVGSSRSNPHIAQLQKDERFTVTENGVQTTVDETLKKYLDGSEGLRPVDRESRRVEIETLAHLRGEERRGSEDENWYWAEKEYDRRLLDAIPAAQFRKYVVVTRKPGTHEGKTITMIAANHGRAAQGVAGYLTERRNVKSLLTDVMKVGIAAVLPAHFQILFEVNMTKEKGDVEAKEINVIEVWTPDVR
jgi:hypothetical protein